VGKGSVIKTEAGVRGAPAWWWGLWWGGWFGTKKFRIEPDILQGEWEAATRMNIGKPSTELGKEKQNTKNRTLVQGLGSRTKDRPYPASNIVTKKVEYKKRQKDEKKPEYLHFSGSLCRKVWCSS